MKYHTEEQYKENAMKLDSHLHIQLKALEEEHGIDYGYEKIKEDYTK